MAKSITLRIKIQQQSRNQSKRLWEQKWQLKIQFRRTLNKLLLYEQTMALSRVISTFFLRGGCEKLRSGTVGILYFRHLAQKYALALPLPPEFFVQIAKPYANPRHHKSTAPQIHGATIS